MSTPQLHVVSPEEVADFLHAPRLRQAFDAIAGLVGAHLSVGPLPEEDERKTDTQTMVVQYRGRTRGHVRYAGNGRAAEVARAAGAMTRLIEHMVEREVAVGDLAGAMITSYEELNLFYRLLPNIATRAHANEIGELLVDETARTLGCRRVSLLVLDEKRERLRVLASRGLPSSVAHTSIPIVDSIVGHALFENDTLLVNSLEENPMPDRVAKGRYERGSFAVIRVPLQAGGDALGVLSATERLEATEFTSRDRKLLEGLSAIAASALLSCRLHDQVNRQMMSAIQALASAVDAKDHYTHDHSGRVAQLCLAAAHELGIRDAAKCRELELAGLLHDIGKIGIPDAILSKADRLTPQEYEVVKTHVQIGARIADHVQGLERVAKAILCHHERYDGLGYPAGLAGDSIPVASKLIAVCDAFDSLTSDRSYRKGIAPEEGLREILRCSGTQFDPDIVEAFRAVIERELGPTRRPRPPAVMVH